MIFRYRFFILFLFFVDALLANVSKTPYDLKCENLYNPLGVDMEHPRFSWKLPSTDDLYNSELWLSDDSVSLLSNEPGKCIVIKTEKPNTIHTNYTNEVNLKSFVKYYWKVVSTGNKRKTRLSSQISSFTTSNIDKSPIFNYWISDSNDSNYKPAAYYRKSFSVTKKISSATLSIAAAGLYELSFNGTTVGDQKLNPMYTRYDKRILSVMHDVTSFLKQGENIMGVELGNGWYNHQSTAVWFFDKASWRNRPRFSAELRIKYADGDTQIISTDSSWKTSSSPIVFNSIYTAEHSDFRERTPNWNTTSCDVLGWSQAKVVANPTEKIQSQLLYPIKETARYQCTKFKRLNDSCYIFYFPKNIAGVTELRIKGISGTRVKIKHGEMLNKDGTVNLSNIDYHYRPADDSDPFQTDIIWLSGQEDVFKPKYNYKGFQYVEVTSSAPVELDEKSLTATEMHSAVPQIGNFYSSSEILNKIWKATNSSYLANLFGYPTDCPQREKNGWTGDAHIAIETGLYNFDAITIYEKWLRDFVDVQRTNGVLPCIIPTSVWGYDWANGVDWTGAVCIVPWNVYLFYGDTTLISQMYPVMRKYLTYVESTAKDNLTDWGLGDWVPVNSKSDVKLTTSVYYYVVANIMSKSASLLNKNEDAKYYQNLAQEIKNSINYHYLNSEAGIYASGTQTELAMPLYWGIVPENMKAKVANQLFLSVEKNNFHLDVGLLGSKALLGALSENGYTETAYKVATQETYPSWGYWIKNGATTLHENWRTDVVIDNSYNHIMFGEIGAWLYNSLGGIKIDENNSGFKNIIIRPYFPENMDTLSINYNCPYGKLSLRWQKKDKQKILYSISLPTGVAAKLILPENYSIKKNIRLKSGENHFSIKIKD